MFEFIKTAKELCESGLRLKDLCNKADNKDLPALLAELLYDYEPDKEINNNTNTEQS